MPEIDLGKVVGDKGDQGDPGSQWYYGTAITGTSASGTVFSNSGIENALVNDKYLNTATNDVYTCVGGGDAATAQWSWICNIQGIQGPIGPAGPTGAVNEDTPITYSTPSEYSAPASGNTIAVLFGKITKGLSDLFTSVAAKLDSSKVLESRNITQEGYVMGGKTACEWMTELNDDIDPTYTANRALISNGSGKASVSDITSSELACLDGATENIPNRLSTMQSSLTSNNNRLSNVIGGIIPGSGVLLDWAKDDASRRIIWKVIGEDGFTGTPDDSSEWCIANYNAGTSPNRGIVIAYELDSPYRVQYRYYYNNSWVFAWQSIK